MLRTGIILMTIREQVGVRPLESGVRPLESVDDLEETRLGAVGFIFHGTIPQDGAKRATAKAGTNLLHFARCAKLEKAGEAEAKIWFRTIGIAKEHLDQTVGTDRWKWCKVCEREITQKIINER